MSRSTLRHVGPVQVDAHDLDAQLFHRPEREVRIAAQCHRVVLHTYQEVPLSLRGRQGESGSEEDDRCEDPDMSTQ